MLFSKSVQNEFINKINSLVLGGDYCYIEAVIAICEEYEVEPVVAAKYLTKPIIEKLEAEGIEFNLLPRKSSELPV